MWSGTSAQLGSSPAVEYSSSRLRTHHACMEPAPWTRMTAVRSTLSGPVQGAWSASPSGVALVAKFWPRSVTSRARRCRSAHSIEGMSTPASSTASSVHRTVRMCSLSVILSTSPTTRCKQEWVHAVVLLAVVPAGARDDVLQPPPHGVPDAVEGLVRLQHRAGQRQGELRARPVRGPVGLVAGELRLVAWIPTLLLPEEQEMGPGPRTM